MRSHEHRALGDAATDRAVVPLAGVGVPLTFGDVVALTGDYFPPAGDGSLFAPTTADDEVVCALQVAAADEQHLDHRFRPGGHFAGRRLGSGPGQSDVERRVRDRYLALAAANDDHFVAPGRADVVTASGAPSAITAYRRLHQDALDEAWVAGRDSSDAIVAMGREAAAQHYLTDAFAAGHLRTPVADIRAYWKARYPDFWAHLQHKVAAETARTLRELGGPLRLAPAKALERRTATELARRTKRYPELSLGDLVARVYHDWDNSHGLTVEGGGVVFGDGCVDDGDTVALALSAVRAGIDDIEAAHQLGRTGHRAGGPALYEAVRAATGAGDRFRAESLVPVVSSSNAPQNWRAGSAEELWAAPVVGAGGPTVGQALEEMLAPGGTFIRQLEALGQGLSGGGGAFAVPLLGPWLARQCCTAFSRGFVEPLSRDPGTVLRSVIPDFGHSAAEDQLAAAS